MSVAGLYGNLEAAHSSLMWLEKPHGSIGFWHFMTLYDNVPWLAIHLGITFFRPHVIWMETSKIELPWQKVCRKTVASTKNWPSGETINTHALQTATNSKSARNRWSIATIVFPSWPRPHAMPIVQGYGFRGAGSKCITAFTDLKRGFGAWTRIVSIVRMSAVSLSLAVETRLSHDFFAGKTTTWQGDINDAGGQCHAGNSGRWFITVRLHPRFWNRAISWKLNRSCRCSLRCSFTILLVN
jgi:hypothetical protein